MSSVGACLDNAVVERLFGSLKLLNVVHLTRETMKIYKNKCPVELDPNTLIVLQQSCRFT